MRKIFLFIALTIGLVANAQTKDQQAVEAVVKEYFQHLTPLMPTKLYRYLPLTERYCHHKPRQQREAIRF